MIRWIFDKLNIRSLVWPLIVAASILAILFLYSKSAGGSLDKPVGDSLWWWGLGGEISGLILTSIFAGAILKILAVEGFFSDALAEIIYGDAGIDRIGDEEKLALWRNLTMRIYIPSLHQEIKRNRISNNNSNSDLDLFAGSLTSSVADRFSYNRQFYIKSVNRSVKIELDGAIVFITDEIESRLVPFDGAATVNWMSMRTAQGSLDLNGYEIKELMFSVRNKDGSECRCQGVTETNESTETTTYSLSGSTEYVVYWKRRRSWDVTKDCMLQQSSPYVVRDGTLRIENAAPGLQVQFMELGGEGLYRPIEGALPWVAGTLKLAHNGVLLPDQGFQLIMFLRN